MKWMNSEVCRFYRNLPETQLTDKQRKHLLNCIIKRAQLESERRNKNNDFSVWGFEIVLSTPDTQQKERFCEFKVIWYDIMLCQNHSVWNVE